MNQNKKVRINRILNAVFWMLCFLVVCGVLFWNFYRDKKLKENGVLVICKITDIASSNKNSPSFLCDLYYNGTIKKGYSSSSSAKKLNVFVGEYFPAIYSPDIDILEVLITPKDFEEYNIKFPDSLNWVIKYELSL